MNFLENVIIRHFNFLNFNPETISYNDINHNLKIIKDKNMIK